MINNVLTKPYYANMKKVTLKQQNIIPLKNLQIHNYLKHNMSVKASFCFKPEMNVANKKQ